VIKNYRDISWCKLGSWILASLVVALFSLHASDAGAQNCGHVDYSLSADDLEVVVGQQYTLVGSILKPKKVAAVCVTSAGGSTSHVLSACNATAVDPITLETGRGDDVIYTYRSGNPVFSCGGTLIGPWATIFSFGISGALGAGSDVFYGSPNDDRMISSYHEADTYSGYYNLWVEDGSMDVLCGYEGTDALYGDAGDSASDFECLDGGSGVDDYCHGLSYSTPETDQAMSSGEFPDGCETVLGATTTWILSGACSNACPSTPPSP